MSYNSEPISHFQKIIRRGSMELVDHMTRPLTPLEKARVELIPPGGDWRDLPNMERKLEDGTVAKKLLYRYKDFNQGKHIFIFIFFILFFIFRSVGLRVPAWGVPLHGEGGRAVRHLGQAGGHPHPLDPPPQQVRPHTHLQPGVPARGTTSTPDCTAAWRTMAGSPPPRRSPGCRGSRGGWCTRSTTACSA